MLKTAVGICLNIVVFIVVFNAVICEQLCVLYHTVPEQHS